LQKLIATLIFSSEKQLTYKEEVTYSTEVSDFVWCGFLVFSKRKPDTVF